MEKGEESSFGLPGFPPYFLGRRLLWGFESNFNGFLRARGGVLKPCQDRDMTRPESLSHLVGGAERDGRGGGFSRRGVKRERISGDRGKGESQPQGRLRRPSFWNIQDVKNIQKKKRKEGGHRGPLKSPTRVAHSLLLLLLLLPFQGEEG